MGGSELGKDQAPGRQAREALIANLISYGVQLGILLAVAAAAHHKGWFQHRLWMLRNRPTTETRADAEYRQARRGLHDDIRRLEYGEG